MNVARDYLNLCHPCPGTSAVAENRLLDPRYDVTVIVPCYNMEKHIRQCVESILTQKTTHTFLLTVVDDGSTDASPDILDSYANRKNVRVIRQENAGLSAARNAALRCLESSYVMFVDADDYLAEDALDSLMSVAKEYGVDEVEGKINSPQGDGDLIPGDAVSTEPRVVSPLQLSGYAWGKVQRASLFENVRFPEQYWFEDTIESFLIHTRARSAAFVSKVCYNYRRNESGITAKSHGNTKSIDTWWVLEQMIKDMKELNIPFTQEIYEMMLEHIALSFVRTHELGEEVQMASLLFAAGLMEPYLNEYHTGNRFQSILEKALQLRDMSFFKQGCALAWDSRIFHHGKTDML